MNCENVKCIILRYVNTSDYQVKWQQWKQNNAQSIISNCLGSLKLQCIVNCHSVWLFYDYDNDNNDDDDDDGDDGDETSNE